MEIDPKATKKETIFDKMRKVRMQLPMLAPKLFHIRTKEMGIIPFQPSIAQIRFWSDDNIGSDLVLKARQLGISTMTVIEFLAYALYIEGFNGVIISEDREKTKRLLRIAHLALNMMPKEMKIARDHAREDYVYFKPPPEGTGSGIYIGTAGQASFGRGDTVHAAHCSELGLWDNAEELLNGLEEAVPLRPGAILRIESTAFGRGNHFHKLCDRAMHKRGGRYNFHFFPWWFAIDDEYQLPLNEGESMQPTDEEKEFIETAHSVYAFSVTKEHLKWRRTKIDQKGMDLFQQEYPEDPENCFLSSGNAVFEGIMKMLNVTAKRLRNNEPLFEETVRGVEIKRYKLPKAGEIYVLLVDTSEGTKEASAFDAFTIWRYNPSGSLEQAVTGFGRVDSTSLTHVICEFSAEYNNAMIGVERANKGFSILDKLLIAQDQYDFEIYSHTEFDQIAGKHISIPGWRPTVASKSAAIGRLEEMFKQGEFIVYDVQIIDQMMAYQYDPNTGRAGPPEGSYSDLLTTAMIACYICEDIPSAEMFTVEALE